MKYEIEKGIPIPNRARHTGLAKALRQLNVGDSLLIPAKQKESAYSNARYGGIKVTLRAAGNGNIRVWRTK